MNGITGFVGDFELVWEVVVLPCVRVVDEVLVEVSTVVFGDATEVDGDVVDAAVLVVSVVVGMAEPVLVVVFAAFVLLDPLDVAAFAVSFTIFVGEFVLFWDTAIKGSVVDAKTIVWNVFAVTMPAITVACRVEVRVVVAPTALVAADVVAAISVTLVVVATEISILA